MVGSAVLSALPSAAALTIPSFLRAGLRQSAVAARQECVETARDSVVCGLFNLPFQSFFGEGENEEAKVTQKTPFLQRERGTSKVGLGKAAPGYSTYSEHRAQQIPLKHGVGSVHLNPVK